MQPHTEHSHTSPVLHLGSHTFGSLLRSRKAVGVSKKAGLLFAWMILGVLLVGCLPSNAPPPGDPYAEPDTTSQTFGEGWTPEANSVHLNPRITCSADPTPANVANAVRGVNIVNPNVVLINPPQGAWLSFNQGGAVGRYLQIVSMDAATLKLTLLVNAEGSHVGIDFHGPVYCSRLMNNTVTGTQSYQYGSDNH